MTTDGPPERAPRTRWGLDRSWPTIRAAATFVRWRDRQGEAVRASGAGRRVGVLDDRVRYCEAIEVRLAVTEGPVAPEERRPGHERDGVDASHESCDGQRRPEAATRERLDALADRGHVGRIVIQPA